MGGYASRTGENAVAAVLANRLFRQLWIGQISSQLAANMTVFLLALVVYQATGSNAAVSGLFFAYGVPAILLGFVAGAVVDRLDRRRVLIVCDIVRAVLVVGLFFLTHNIPLVYLIVFLNAVVTQFYVPAEAPTIPRVVPTDLILAANSLFSFTYYSSMAAGFILAGPLLRVAGTKPALLLLSALFVFASISVSRLPPQTEGAVALRNLLRMDLWRIIKKVIAGVLAGVSYVRSSPVLFDGLLLLTGTQVILAMLGTLGPGFADRMLGIDVRDASVIIVGPTVMGIVLGALWVGNQGRRYPPERLIRWGIIAAGVFLILIAVTVRLKHIALLAWIVSGWVVFPLEIMLFFLLGVANSLLDVPANSILQREAEGSMRGRIYGMLAAAVGGLGILPVVAGGVLADTIGVGKVIFLLGIVVLGYGIWRVRYNGITGK